MFSSRRDESYGTETDLQQLSISLAFTRTTNLTISQS